jgi:hypothetical protein
MKQKAANYLTSLLHLHLTTIIIPNAGIAAGSMLLMWLKGTFLNALILLTSLEELSHQKYNRNI